MTTFANLDSLVEPACLVAVGTNRKTPVRLIAGGGFSLTHNTVSEMAKEHTTAAVVKAGRVLLVCTQNDEHVRRSVAGSSPAGVSLWIRSHCSGPLECWPASTRVASRAKGTMCDGLTVRARRARLRAAAMLSDESIMGGRCSRLSAEAGLKRAAAFVVQVGNGATPTNTPPKECRPEMAPEAIYHLSTCSRVWKTEPLRHAVTSVESGSLPVTLIRSPAKYRNGAARMMDASAGQRREATSVAGFSKAPEWRTGVFDR